MSALLICAPADVAVSEPIAAAKAPATSADSMRLDILFLRLRAGCAIRPDGPIGYVPTIGTPRRCPGVPSRLTIHSNARGSTEDSKLTGKTSHARAHRTATRRQPAHP